MYIFRFTLETVHDLEFDHRFGVENYTGESNACIANKKTSISKI